jgi:hypothetical protein
VKKEYDTFLLGTDKLPDGRECQIVVRDLTPGKYKYQSFHVKAIVSSSAEQLPEGDTLWVRTELGRLDQHPWKIRIIEPLEDL